MAGTYTPLNPVQVEQRLRQTVHELTEQTDYYEQAAVAAAKAEAAWKLHEAEVIVTRESGSVAEAERTAKHGAGDVYQQYKVTDALERAAKEKLRSLQAELSALQTVSGALRDQFKSVNSAGYGA